jgi:hypothetical protein
LRNNGDPDAGRPQAPYRFSTIAQYSRAVWCVAWLAAPRRLRTGAPAALADGRRRYRSAGGRGSD